VSSRALPAPSLPALSLGAAFVAALVLSVAVGILARDRAVPLLCALQLVVLMLPGLAAVVRRAPGGVPATIAAIAATPVVVAGTWTATHPLVHVDNALGQPIDVWIDGRRRATIAPTAADREPAWLRVSTGRHRIGWSTEGGPAALHEIEIELGARGESLYVPGAAACHWLAATAYGEASTHGLPHGPLPIAEFHRFERVDVWFGDTPRRVPAASILPGTVRFALQRYEACMRLVDLGCAPERRVDLVECARAAPGQRDDESGAPIDCYEEARRGCEAAPNERRRPTDEAGRAVDASAANP
jgi:hypothetical protein